MPNGLLDEMDRRAALKRMRAMAMTEIMIANAPNNPSPSSGLLCNPQQVTRVERSTYFATREHECVFVGIISKKHAGRFSLCWLPHHLLRRPVYVSYAFRRMTTLKFYKLQLYQRV